VEREASKKSGLRARAPDLAEIAVSRRNRTARVSPELRWV